MKTVFGWIVIPLVLAGLFVGYLAAVFAVSLVVAGLIGSVGEVSWAWAYFSVGWKIYVAFIPLTFLFLVTFSFQHCCVGLNTFRGHYKHTGWQQLSSEALEAIAWPYIWFVLDRNLKTWGTCLFDALLGAIAYWVIDHWQGTTITTITAAGVETTRVKSPEDAVVVLKEVILDSKEEKTR